MRLQIINLPSDLLLMSFLGLYNPSMLSARIVYRLTGFLLSLYWSYICDRGRLAEGSDTSFSELRHRVRIPSRKRKHFSLPARAGPIGNIESLGPVGGRVSVVAPLPERLPGLVEGSYDHSLLLSTVFLVVISS